MLRSMETQRVRHDRATELNWTVAHQAPPPMGFSRKNTGVGGHFLLQGIFPTQGLKPRSLALQANSLLSETPEKPPKGCDLGQNQARCCFVYIPQLHSS